MESPNILRRLLLTAVFTFTLCSTQAERSICLRQPSQVGVSILGGMEAGNFVQLGTAKNINDCLNMACESQEGNIAFLLHQTCFSVQCYNIQSCELETADNARDKTAGAVYRIIDAYPEFKNVPHTIYVDEDTPSQKKILSLEVTAESRKNERETMSFKIQSGNSAKTFRLDHNHSRYRVTIRTQRPLDREKIPYYQLTINATNKVENASTLLNITINVTDVNDNLPVFVKSVFVFNVFTNMSVGTSLGHILAKDKDTGSNAKARYSITSKTDLVNLNQSTGEVKLNRQLQVDTVKSFDYQITATDGFHTTTGRLNVEVYPNNINRPTFYKQSHEVRLHGQVSIGTEVIRVSASDPDFGKLGELTFLITNGNEDGTFQITSEGEVRTLNKIPLHRDMYNLTVFVHDNGYPELYALRPANVVILVQWLRFKQDIYETAVPENHPIFAKIFTVGASLWVGGTELMAAQRQGMNSGINYYLDDVISLDQFEMEETTGDLTLQKALDFETRKVYELELKADYVNADLSSRRDELTAKAILRLQVIDVNDNAPRFSHLFYSQDVWKSTKENSPVLRINATDADEGNNGRIQFIILSGNINDTFSLHSDGMVFLRKSLTHTKLSTFNLTVAAWDRGTPPRRSRGTALISIHVRGYKDFRTPVFEKDSYSAKISEGVPINTRIVQVKANIQQGRKPKITYWIRNSRKIPFRVESSTGWIRTTEGLDRENKNSYVLMTVASTDLGQMSLTTMVNVTIVLEDENDNRPVFSRDSYSSVLTSNKAGVKVLRIKATDKDRGANAKIVYEIKGGKDQKYFSVDRRSGLIKTRTFLPIKSLHVLKFFVSATDEGKPPMISLNGVPVFVLMGSTFPIDVKSLGKTTTEIQLRFTLINVSLANVSHFGVVVQESDNIAEYEEVTKRALVSWFYVHNAKGNGVYAQRYLTGKVECTDLVRETKTLDFTVGTDGDQCNVNKNSFCNGKLQAEKKYRFQLVAYFKNGTSPENVTFVESEMSSAVETQVNNAKRTAGFRSWRYDAIVIVVGVLVGLIILATITRAIILYRRDNNRMKQDEAKDSVSYPLSNPRYQRAGEHSPTSRSTISFTELSKSRKSRRRSEKESPSETEKLQITPDDSGGVSRDSGCGVSVKSSNSDINQGRISSVRQAFFSFGCKDKDDEQEADDKEAETELNT